VYPQYADDKQESSESGALSTGNRLNCCFHFALRYLKAEWPGHFGFILCFWNVVSKLEESFGGGASLTDFLVGQLLSLFFFRPSLAVFRRRSYPAGGRSIQYEASRASKSSPFSRAWWSRTSNHLPFAEPVEVSIRLANDFTISETMAALQSLPLAREYLSMHAMRIRGATVSDGRNCLLDHKLRRSRTFEKSTLISGCDGTVLAWPA
jgi:hypothetical protein